MRTGGGGPAGVCGDGDEVMGGGHAGICGDRIAVLEMTRWMQGLPELLTDAPRSWQIFSKVSVVEFSLYKVPVASTFLEFVPVYSVHAQRGGESCWRALKAATAGRHSQESAP